MAFFQNDHAKGGTTWNFTFYTVSTAVDLTNTTQDADGKTAFDNLSDALGFAGQPVLFGTVTGSGPYSVRVAYEHNIANSVLQSAARGFDANATVVPFVL